MNILKKINKMRIDRGWSVYRLSVESGVSQSTITNMFNRETLPSITTLESICTAFGVTMSEFFTEENFNTEPDDEEVLALYRSMNAESRQLVLGIMRELSSR